METPAPGTIAANNITKGHAASIGGVRLIDVAGEAEARQRGPELDARGHSATTLIRTEDFRVVLIAIKAGETVQEHHSSHGVTLQTLRGRVQVHVSERVFDLPVGSLLLLERSVAHEVQAIEDSVFLVSIAWPEPRASEPVLTSSRAT